MNSYTPGPWEYKKVWQSPSYEIFHEVCHIANVYGAGKQNEGNARLMAAAPEMAGLLADAINGECGEGWMRTARELLRYING